jgi:hypothetical protein
MAQNQKATSVLKKASGFRGMATLLPGNIRSSFLRRSARSSDRCGGVPWGGNR